MCGIVGYIGNKKATPILVNGLKALEYRGYDSSGVAVYDETQPEMAIDLVKTKGRLADLEERLSKHEPIGHMGIGHTRWATHGEPSTINAHPHLNGEQTLALVHNGIIENYMQLKDELIEKGHVFVSETDTETIVHLIEEEMKVESDFFSAVLEATHKLRGSYALAVMSKEEPDKIIAVRKDSPLVIGVGNHENFIASDIPALLNYTRNVYFLEDGEAAVITQNAVQIYDSHKQELKKQVFVVTWDIHAAEKGGYSHFMAKEIHEQPTVIRDTLMTRLTEKDQQIRLESLTLSKERLEGINRIYVVACGTAYYAGIIGKELMERIAKVPVIAEVASEFRYKDPMLDDQTLLMVVSQSGETADTLAALRMAKKAGAHTIGIVNVVGSTIAREADDVLYTSAGPEIAVASTKAYSSQLIAMYLISIHMGRLLGRVDDSKFIQLKKDILKLPEQVEQILSHEDEIKALAQKYLKLKNIFYIGRGLDYASSLEGALKIKEVAYLHAESYQAGELKHGPIALIEKGSVLMGLLGQEVLMEKTISNIKEVKARGASVIAIALEGNTLAKQVADDVIYVPKTSWMFTSLLVNIPQQLFAYHIACGLGHDVDKPRNLAKSVTVE